MPGAERHWTAALAAGTLLVGSVTLGPALFPQARAPAVTRMVLPAVSPAQAEPPVYARTASITPLISGRVNLNTATQEQLEALPKVGPSLAQRIIAGRPYRSLADLNRVKGVGDATMRLLSPLVTY